MFDVCLLGTAGMMPLKNRFLTSLYTEYQGNGFLIDCGEGTQVALSYHGLKMSRITYILITHAHADHISGLPGLLLSIGNNGRTSPVTIVYPESAEYCIKALLTVCGELPYEVVFHPVSETEPVGFDAADISPELRIRSMPVSHTVPCVGYSAVLNRRPVFIPEKAKALGVPVDCWKDLHSGNSVTLDNGTVVTTDQVIGAPRKPLKLTYVTDTLPIPEIAAMATDSDLFICEGMYGDIEKKKSMNEKGHMLMQDACGLAVAAGVKRLWLTHFSPAVKDPQIYSAELKTLFHAVTVPEDGTKIQLK